MSDINTLKEKVIQAVFDYNLQSLHIYMIDFTNYVECQLSNNGNIDLDFVRNAFEAYQNHDYLRLSDLFEYDWNKN